MRSKGLISQSKAVAEGQSLENGASEKLTEPYSEEESDTVSSKMDHNGAMAMEETDEQLVRSYLDGNEAAFAVLVDRYLRHLFHFVRQLVGDEALAQDVAQETFVKIWKHLRRFDDGKSFKIWAFAIAKNTAYDAVKKKKTLPFSWLMDEEGKSVLDTIADERPDANDILDQEATAQDLTEKLATLTPLYRSLLSLHYQEHFSLHEIALILGEPYNTVKSRHERALKRLKAAFLVKVRPKESHGRTQE